MIVKTLKSLSRQTSLDRAAESLLLGLCLAASVYGLAQLSATPLVV